MPSLNFHPRECEIQEKEAVTYSSAFRSRESHDTSLTSCTRWTCRSGAAILTSGALLGGKKARKFVCVFLKEQFLSEQSKKNEACPPVATHSGSSLAIGARTSRATSQTLQVGGKRKES